MANALAARQLHQGQASERSLDGFPLSFRQRLLDPAPERLYLGFGRVLVAGRPVCLLGGVVQADVLVAAAPQLRERAVHRDRRGPGREATLALEGVELLVNAEQALSKFAASFAADLDPELAAFRADSQVPWGVGALDGAVHEPAWKSKRSFYLVATDDKMIPPPAQRAMSKRAGATVVEAKGSHAIYESKPAAVAALIEQASRAAR
ncbi:MAG TPA: alpha/beta fold hydrolase [Polyangiaceae bacterium]|nr:alpha/beta fold hydrolase [Polyangiaceae bacterium]